jgi:hypothetical protein
MAVKPMCHAILDLDQTLISAEYVSDAKKISEITRNSLEPPVEMKGSNGSVQYIVYKRPFLKEFLEYLFNNYIVSVWTAASKDYAVFIVNNIILPNAPPGKCLDFLLYHDHCKQSVRQNKQKKDKKKYSKHLGMLFDVWKYKDFNGVPYTASNTFIIDDLPDISDIQPKNCITAPPFFVTESGSEHDNFLSTLKTELSGSNIDCNDVQIKIGGILKRIGPRRTDEENDISRMEDDDD